MRYRKNSKFLVALALSVCLHCLPMAGQCKESAADVRFRQLERDVPSLYLINGLFLSKEQTGKLCSILRKAESVENKHNKQAERLLKKSQRDIEKCTDKVIRGVSKSGALDRSKLSRSSNMRKLHKARQELAALRGEMERELAPLADKTYTLLSPAQQDIVGSFIPCFIPDRDFRNPERVGQAVGDTSAGEKILSRLREASESRLSSFTERSLDHAVKYVMYKRHIKYSEDAEHRTRGELSGKFEEIVPRARELSDVDFELQKSDLSRELLPLEEVGEHYSSDSVVRWKTKRYLLNTGIINVLKVRSVDGCTSATVSSVKKGLSNGAKKPLQNSGVSGFRRNTSDFRRAYYTATVIAGLNLSSSQAGKLQSIVGKALKEKERVESEIEKTKQEAVEPYELLRGELSRQQPTQETETAANRFHNGVKRLNQVELMEALLGCEHSVDKVLTVGQVDYLMKCDARRPRPGTNGFSADSSNSSPGKPRPAVYSHKYIRGEPLEVLKPTSGFLFTEIALEMLEKLSGGGR